MTGSEGGEADPLSRRRVQVRAAVLDDVDALVALRAEMFRAMGAAGVDDPAWQRAARAWFQARLDDPDVRIAVVEEDGAVVSAAIGMHQDGIPSPRGDGSTVHVSNVSTLPQARNRGYARLALEAVLAWADQRGAAKVDLFATADGRAMYERAGFVEHAYPALRRVRPG